MRNGLLLIAVALTLALLPAASYASAPIFQNVPGVITLEQTAGGTTASLSNIFIFDSSVYDPDTADADLAWSFLETAADLTVTDVIPGGASNVFATVTGIGAIADLASAATLAPGAANDLAADAAFSLMVDSATVGINASVVAAYAGTTAANVAADDLYTTIILVATDGTNYTTKEVVVKADYAATGNGAAGGVNTTELTIANTAIGTTFAFLVQLQSGKVSGNSAGNSLVLTITDPGTFSGGYTDIGSGFYYANNQVAVQAGKVYFMRVNCLQGGGATLASAIGPRIAFMHPAFLYNAYFTAQNDPTIGGYNFQPFAQTGNNMDIEAIMEITDDARWSGVLYGLATGYTVAVEQENFVGLSGSITYTNFAVYSADAPEFGLSNGLAYYADTQDDFTSSGALPMDYLNDEDTTGWKQLSQRVESYQMGNDTNQGFQFVNTLDTNWAVNAGYPATAYNAVSSNTNIDLSGGFLLMRSNVATKVLQQATIGNNNGGNDNTHSLVPASVVAENVAAGVYYRGTYYATSDSSTGAGFPSILFEVGNPAFAWVGALQMNEGSSTLPISGSVTAYPVWVKSAPVVLAGTQVGVNNIQLQVDFQDLDFVGSTGGELRIDKVGLEIFPESFFF